MIIICEFSFIVIFGTSGEIAKRDRQTHISSCSVVLNVPASYSPLLHMYTKYTQTQTQTHTHTNATHTLLRQLFRNLWNHYVAPLSRITNVFCHLSQCLVTSTPDQLCKVRSRSRHHAHSSVIFITISLQYMCMDTVRDYPRLY